MLLKVLNKGSNMRVIFLFSLALVTACSERQDTQHQREIETVINDPKILLIARPLDENRVQFEVETTLPLPVEVMASVSLTGQAADDVYIGHQERIKIEKSESTFIIDTTNAKGAIPSGEYEAKVSFYPLWGAKNGNPAAENVSELHAISNILLKGASVDRADAERKNNLQRWVMNNLGMNEPWNRETYEAKLGKSQKGPSTMSHLHDAYYFPDADITLLVNRLKSQVTVWRMGDVTE